MLEPEQEQGKSGVYQLQGEIERLVNRYSEESDLTIAELIGVLEIVKQKWIHSLFQNPLK